MRKLNCRILIVEDDPVIAQMTQDYFTARTLEEDKLFGYDLGCDDFLCVQFMPYLSSSFQYEMSGRSLRMVPVSFLKTPKEYLS